MRIRPGHIAFVFLAAITVFMIYAALMIRRDVLPPEDLDGLAPPMDMPMADTPMVALESDNLNLGVIPHDQDYSIEIPVHNRGRRTLEIREVRSSCPLCIVGVFKPGGNRIPAGDSSMLTITVKPGGVLGFHTIKTLTMMTNDPRTPQVILTVEAHIDPEFTLEPDVFDFGTVQKGEAAQSEVILRQQTDAPITLREVSLRSGEDEKADAFASIVFNTTLLPEDAWHAPGKRAYRITATLSPYMPAGDFQLSVFVRTDVERFPFHHMYARGTVEAPYAVTFARPGTVLTLRGHSPEEKIDIRADKAVTLSDVRSEAGMIICHAEHPTPENAVLTCSLHPDTQRGVYTDAVIFTVEIAGDSYPERVPVHVFAYGDAADADKD